MMRIDNDCADADRVVSSTSHAPISILEDEDRCLVYLDGELATSILMDRMIDVGFFACRDAAVDLVKYAAVEHLKHDHSCSRIENLECTRATWGTCMSVLTHVRGGGSVLFN